MNTINSIGFGGMFLVLAAIFALGVSPRFARYYYPVVPGLTRRLAAPVIFALLSIACFMGAGVHALLIVVVMGLPFVVARRLAHRKQRRRLSV